MTPLPSPRLIGAALLACALGLGTAAAAGLAPSTSPDQAAAEGLHIFNHDRFGGVRTCSSCHVNGGTMPGHLPGGAKLPSLEGAAAQFPKYNGHAHHVVTLEQQIVHCIRGGLQGKPPAAASPQMSDLIAYLTKLSKGATMGQQFK